MISKLRRKFVLINMMFVMAVMVTVMIILYASTYKNDQNSIDRSLEMSLSDNKKDLRPSIGQNTSLSGAADGANANTEGGTGDNGGTGTDFHGSPEGLDAGSLSAVFTVEADEDGNIVSIDDTMVQIDKSTVVEAVQSVLSSEKDKGHIFSLALAYKTKTISSGTKIAFLDISSINSSLRKLIVNELLIFLGSMLVFFAISLYLSRLVVKPVEEAWNRQKQFVADASHELKTPLTVILANLEIIRERPDETIGKQIKWINNTKQEAVRMKELLEDLLFLARSDASRVPIPKQPVDLSGLVWSSMLLFESVAYEAHVELADDIESGLSVNGDEKQLKQLLTILLDNACKYGKNGKVTVSLKPAEKDRISLSVNNTVADEKEIIPKEEQAHVFERFFRGDKARVHMEGGYGLGLSIAATIAEAHRGKIRISSDLKNGTTFTVTIPARND